MSNEEKPVKKKKIAVILVRGLIGVKKEVVNTLKMLNLQRKNHCVVVEKNPSVMGMIKKINNYITYGEISDDVFKELVEKKAEEYSGRLKDSKGKIEYKKFIVINGKKYKKFFRLNPPRKGFGRKGIKKHFNVGGALSYRGDKINELIKRML